MPIPTGGASGTALSVCTRSGPVYTVRSRRSERAECCCSDQRQQVLPRLTVQRCPICPVPLAGDRGCFCLLLLKSPHTRPFGSHAAPAFSTAHHTPSGASIDPADKALYTCRVYRSLQIYGSLSRAAYTNPDMPRAHPVSKPVCPCPTRARLRTCSLERHSQVPPKNKRT